MPRFAIALSILISLGVVGCANHAGVSDGAAATTPPSTPAAAAAADRARQDAEVAHAIAELDRMGGERVDLESVRSRLEQVLAENPGHVQAHIELARCHLRLGYIAGDDYDRQAVARAESELKRALEIDPRSANAYVLLGIVRVDQRQPQLAIQELRKAEAIGTDNPWLDLNFIAAYIQMEQWDLAATRLTQFEANLAKKSDVPAKIKAAAVDYWMKVHTATHDRKGLSADYEHSIALAPDNPWAHGNFAFHLLTEEGRTDDALEHATKAVSLLSYGNGHRTLGLAQYAKWASLRASNPKQAEALYAEAQENLQDMGYVMSTAGAAVERNEDFKRLVTALMERKLSIDAKDPDGGRTALRKAASLGRLESIKWLLAKGASVSVRDDQMATPLALAAIHHDVEVVSVLVAHGADVNAPDDGGRTPLLRAVYMNDEPMVATLIASKAKVDAATPDGETALLRAVSNGVPGIVKRLLAAGADRSRKAPNGLGLAEVAERSGHPDVAALLREPPATK